MYERKPWTQIEDRTLRELKQVRKIDRWSQIAIIMKEEFQIYGRNGKQCRQRYHNHLDSRISVEEWSVEQEKKLLDLHNKWGNRWAAISRELPGRYTKYKIRTDNCVKNHFYACFRKGIKHINTLMNENKKNKNKPLKLTLINKIIDVIQSYHKDHQNYNQNLYELAKCIQSLLFLEIKTFIINIKIKIQNSQKDISQSILWLNQKISEFCLASRKKMGRKKKIKILSQDSQEIEDVFTPLKIQLTEKKLFSNSQKNGKFDEQFNHQKLEIKNEEVFKNDKEKELQTFPLIEQTPKKSIDREQKYQNFSYSNLNSADYLQGKSYGNSNPRELIYLDQEKQWKLYFD